MPFTSCSRSAYRPCKIVRSEEDIQVQDGLALTPAQVADLTNSGVPISQPLAMNFFDGYKTLDFDPGILGRRGVDITDLWNAQQDARKKMRDYAASVPRDAPEGGE